MLERIQDLQSFTEVLEQRKVVSGLKACCGVNGHVSFFQRIPLKVVKSMNR